MKKLQKTLPVLMVVLALSVTGLAGCQIFSGQQPVQTGTDDAPQDTRIGVLQSLGGAQTNNEGTNILTMDDGTTVLLKSLVINLDDQQYLGQRVEVTGELTYTTDNKELMQVETINVLDAVTAPTQQQQAPEWRPYVNAALGFQVQYRDDFQMSDNASSATFTKQITSSDGMMTQEDSSMQTSATHTITINVTPKNPGQTLLQYLHLSDGSDTTLFANGYSPSKIGMDGIAAYKSVTTNGMKFSFENDSNFYQISYVGGNDSESLEDQNVFYDFLASFQFLNGTSTQQISYNSTTPTLTVPTPSYPSISSPSSDTSNTSSSNSDSGSSSSTSPTSGDSGSSSSTSPTSGDSNQISPAPTPTPNPVPVSPSSSNSADATNNSPLSSTLPSTSSTNSDSSSQAMISPTTGTSDSGTNLSNITTSTSADIEDTQQLLPGYSSFSSTSYKFTLEYPKNWYYGQTTTTDPSVVRRYDFGAQPVDQVPGTVNFDIVSGAIPSGSNYTVGDKTAVMTSVNGTNSYYYQSTKGKIYRISGPSSVDFALRSMLSTLQTQ